MALCQSASLFGKIVPDVTRCELQSNVDSDESQAASSLIYFPIQSGLVRGYVPDGWGDAWIASTLERAREETSSICLHDGHHQVSTLMQICF
jgi:hypothetical protein